MGRPQAAAARRHGVTDERVLAALEAVDRSGFAPPGSAVERDAPVPLPGDQTTSQPSLIASMIESLELRGQERVLEVGAGYGYQTALLAQLCREVVAVERDAGLAAAAEANLAAAGMENAQVVVRDGSQGVAERAPYDAIVVAAAAAEVPAALAAQLVVGGRLVIPVGAPGTTSVCRYVAGEQGLSEPEVLVTARFVPLVTGETTKRPGS